MSLQEILKEIKELTVIAEENVESGPIQTLAAKRGRKNQAIQQLKLLKTQYKQELTRSAMFIVVTGSNAEDFTKIVQKNFGLFNVDTELFYKDLANRVPPVLYLGKENVSNIFDVLGRHLEDKMSELDILAYNQLLFKAGYAKQIKTTEEFTQLVKQAINKQIGAEIAGIQAINSLVDVAINKNHADKVTPIVLPTQDSQFVFDLLKDLPRLTNRVFLVVAGEAGDDVKTIDNALILKDTNKKTVEATLKEIKKNINK